MPAPSLLSNSELLSVMPDLVRKERGATADVIEHLFEIDRRWLYTEAACPSLTAYCVERLHMSEDEARKRVSVARLVGRFPSLLDELRSGAIHLTGLFLLAPHLSEESFGVLFPAARGKTRKQIEVLLASHAPKPDVPERVAPVPEQTVLPGTATAPTGPGTAPAEAARVQPLSATRWSVQFTANPELHDKIERARELLSHALPGGELAPLFERALDALIERETKRRIGAGRPRKQRATQPGSRHIPVDVERQVRERDGEQCTYVDANGNRCSARHFLTIEHKDPYARGGPPTVDNLALLCKAHNHYAARKVFGEKFIERKRVLAKVHTGLRNMGFREKEARDEVRRLEGSNAPTEFETLFRMALQDLVPAAPARGRSP